MQTGSRLQELMQVLPVLSKDQVQKLVKELKLQGIIFNKGTTRSAHGTLLQLRQNRVNDAIQDCKSLFVNALVRVKNAIKRNLGRD